MKKLCFVVDDQTLAHEVLADLKETGLTEKNLHVIANDKQALESLPDADVIDEKDVLGGVVRGGAAGAATGMIAGLLAVVVPGAGVIAAGSAVLLGALGGGSFGVWIGSVIGSSVPNSQLEEWRDLIDQGKFLIIVDTDEDQQAAVMETLARFEYEILEFGEKGDIPIL